MFHNIEICYVVDSCPLRPHRKGSVSQLSAVLYVGFFYKSGRHINSKKKKEKKNTACTPLTSSVLANASYLSNVSLEAPNHSGGKLVTWFCAAHLNAD